MNNSDNATPIVSIVMPCYNHGKYVKDAVDSVLANASGRAFEIIIVNDGSTDDHTNEVLKTITGENIFVINQANAGLAAARNTGIKAARGKYILPLDADNKILPPYLTKGIDILEADEGISVVYGNALYFGDKKGEWLIPEWSLQRIMLNNFIDACTIIRKQDLLAVGMFQAHSYMGYEDWDLWLRFSIKGYKFCRLDEFCFEYRVLNDSMVRSLTSQKAKTTKVLSEIYTKYYPYLDPEALDEYILSQYKKSPIGISLKLFLRVYMPKLFKKLVDKNYLHPHF